MRRYILPAILIALLALGSVSCAAPEKKEKRKVEKRAATIKYTDFSYPDTCSYCHTDIYKQWKGSMHNNAYRDPYFQKFYLLASEDTKGLTDDFCIPCHSPVGFLSGEIPPVDGSQLSDLAKEGVQCDFCHTISGSKGIGNASFVSSPGNVKRGPFRDAVSPIHVTAYSELHTKSEFCGMCHNVNHPVNNLPLEKTYTEWKESPYAAQGTQCQDCHMDPIPGKAAIQGPVRPQIFTHTFVGGNAAFTAFLGSPDHQQRAEERLKSAAALKILPPARMRIGVNNLVEVRVTNKGAGHYLPTGITEERQMWLDFKVTDAAGTVVYWSGAVDADGNVDSKAVMYETVVADKEGKRTLRFWLAEKIVSDKRIPPQSTVTEKYSFTVPADVQSPFLIEATLRYRSAHQSVIDELFGKGEFILPIIDMASARVQVR